MNRYYERKMDKNFSLSLICADCSVVDITRGLPDPEMLFDICSCQFALHYSFGTREHARTMVRNAAQHLRKGGFFIGTIPNADVLLYVVTVIFVIYVDFCQVREPRIQESGGQKMIFVW